MEHKYTRLIFGKIGDSVLGYVQANTVTLSPVLLIITNRTTLRLCVLCYL